MSNVFPKMSMCLLLTAGVTVTTHAETINAEATTNNKATNTEIQVSTSEELINSVPSDDVKIISFERMEGCYSDNGTSLSTSSICLFNDGTFYYPMFFGIHGIYKLDGNHLILEPQHNDLFSVYGRHEPRANKTQFQFANFTSNSLIKFDDKGFSDVSDDEQCLSKQRLDVYTHDRLVPSFSVAHVTGTDNPHQQQAPGSQILVAFDYNYDPVFNDFLLIYHNEDKNKNQIKATVLMDKSDMWLQMGKDVLSMQKMRISAEHVQGMKQLGTEIMASSEKYQLINQNGDFSARNLKNYQHKRESNRFHTVAVSDNHKGGENPHKQTKDTTRNHYLKLYEKLEPTGQSLSEAFIESRVGAECS